MHCVMLCVEIHIVVLFFNMYVQMCIAWEEFLFCKCFIYVTANREKIKQKKNISFLSNMRKQKKSSFVKILPVNTSLF